MVRGCIYCGWLAGKTNQQQRTHVANTQTRHRRRTLRYINMNVMGHHKRRTRRGNTNPNDYRRHCAMQMRDIHVNGKANDSKTCIQQRVSARSVAESRSSVSWTGWHMEREPQELRNDSKAHRPPFYRGNKQPMKVQMHVTAPNWSDHPTNMKITTVAMLRQQHLERAEKRRRTQYCPKGPASNGARTLLPAEWPRYGMGSPARVCIGFVKACQLGPPMPISNIASVPQ